MRSERLWYYREKLISSVSNRGATKSRNKTVFAVETSVGVNIEIARTWTARGRKRAKLAGKLDTDLRIKFKRMRRTVVKFYSMPLMYLVNILLEDSDFKEYNRGMIVSSTTTYRGQKPTT